MSQKSAIIKREKSLGEQVVTVLMVALLMASFLYYFLKQDQQIATVGFDVVAANFAAKVSTVRAQWFMDKQPKEVHLKIGDSVKTIIVNKQGWVDDYSSELNCVAIWQQVMDGPLEFMNYPVAAVSIAHNNGDKERKCQFMLVSGEYFYYYPTHGKVTNVMINIQ